MSRLGESVWLRSVVDPERAVKGNRVISRTFFKTRPLWFPHNQQPFCVTLATEPEAESIKMFS